MLTGRFSPRVRTRGTIKQTSRNPPYGGYQLDVAADASLKRCAPEDVALGDLDLVEPERRQHADQHDDAGDDRRGAVGVAGRAPRGARSSGSAASRSSIARSARTTSRWPSTSTAVRLSPRSMPAHWVAVPATATAARDALALRARGPRPRARAPTSARERAELLAAWAGRSAGGARSGARRRPGSRRGSATSPRLADHELGRAAADVDHEQRARRRGVARGGRAEVGQPRLLVAAQRAARRARSARARRAANSAPLAASRTAEVMHRDARARAVVASIACGVLRRARRTRARCGASPSAAAGVDALAQPRDDRAPLELLDAPPAPTSAISSRVEFVPMSTTATRVSWPGAASARRRARRAGCRPRSRSSCARVRTVAEPTWGTTSRFGASQQRVVGGQRLGVGDVERGAGDRAARAARARARPGRRSAPRAVLTSSAVGFMRVERVARRSGGASSGVSGQWSVTKSERSSSSSSGTPRARGCGAPPCRSPRRGARPPGRCGRSRRSRASRRSPRRRASRSGSNVHPLALAHVALALGQPAGEREQQREGEVGGGVGQHVGRVADGDAARASPASRSMLSVPTA